MSGWWNSLRPATREGLHIWIVGLPLALLLIGVPIAALPLASVDISTARWIVGLAAYGSFAGILSAITGLKVGYTREDRRG